MVLGIRIQFSRKDGVMSKQRSRAYPGVTLRVACGLLRERLGNLGSEWVERGALAVLLGYQTGEGGIAARKIAALVHFGLLERSEKGYRLSDAGKKIQEVAESSPEFLDTVRSALKKPALFAGILARFRSGGRIPRQELRRVLTEELGITEQAREDAAEVFVESARFAGVLGPDGTLLDLSAERGPRVQSVEASAESTKSNSESDNTGRISLFEGRPEGAASWEYPSWGHRLGLGIYPLLISVDSHFLPVGTAFCVSRIGLVASAAHNALAALHYHPRGEKILQKDELPHNIDLGAVGLSVLHNWVSAQDTLSVNIWPLEGVQGAQPTDLIFGFPRLQQEFPYFDLGISLAIPRIGSKVICVGYCETDLTGGALSAESLKGGAIRDWPNHYRHKFLAVEGTVRHIFIQEFLPGYLRGACFEIDAEVKPGMSGGPVFNEDGFVCGVISATASQFFGRPSTLVTLFYPAMMTGIKFGAQMGPVRIDATHPLIALINHGSIRTDGTENMVTFIPEGDGWRIGPLIHQDDSQFVFDNFYGLQEGRQAQKETRDVLQLGRNSAEGDSE
jgi:hypothetical protein